MLPKSPLSTLCVLKEKGRLLEFVIAPITWVWYTLCPTLVYAMSILTFALGVMTASVIRYARYLERYTRKYILVLVYRDNI